MTQTSMKPRHRYPAVVTNSKDLPRSITSVAQALEILTGSRGDGLDRALTPRDLIDMGVAQFKGNPNTGGVLVPLQPGTGTPVRIDIPHSPLNVTAVGGFTAVLIRFDEPTYRGHLEAEIWRSGVDLVGSAVMIGTTKGVMFSDVVAKGSTFYYWVRFINQRGDIGPWQGLGGIPGKTEDDIGWLIEKITEEDANSPLVEWLRNDIELISDEKYQQIIQKVDTKFSEDNGPLDLLRKGINQVAQNLETVVNSDQMQSSTSMINRLLLAQWNYADAELQLALGKWGAEVRDGKHLTRLALWQDNVTSSISDHEVRIYGVVLRMAQFDSSVAAINEQFTLIASESAAMARQLTEVRADVGQNSASVLQLSLAQATLNESLSTLQVSVNSRFNTTNANVTQIAQAQSNISQSVATLSESVESKFADTNANVTQLAQTISTVDKSVGTLKLSVESSFNTTNANVTQLSQSQSLLNQSLGTLTQSVNSRFDTTNANVSQLSQSQSLFNQSLGTLQQDVNARFNSSSATVTQLSQAVAAANNNFTAMWGVKTEVNGLAAGFGLYNNGSYTSFVVNANRFSMLGPAGLVNPFVISNNQVLIDKALIRAASIQELVSGTVVADTLVASASLSSPRIIGGSITGSDLSLLSGSYRMDLYPYQTFMFWAGPAGVEKNAANACLAVSNAGAVYAKGITILDPSGNIILDSSGYLKATYIKDLSVDTLDIRGGAINLKEISYLSASPSLTDNVLMASCSVYANSMVPGSLVDVEYRISFYLSGYVNHESSVEYIASLYWGETLVDEFIDIVPSVSSVGSQHYVRDFCRINGRYIYKYTAAALDSTIIFSVYLRPKYTSYKFTNMVIDRVSGYLTIDLRKR